MVTKSMIFNDCSVNIFTDASICKINNYTYGCPGYSVYIGESMIDEGCCIDYGTTNNISELNAIFIGVKQAQKYQNYKYIRIFSDSQTSVFALRDRIFNWINNVKDGYLYGSSKNPIANQDKIMEIIYYIIYNNIRIEFYHQKGHVDFNNSNSLLNALRVFKDSNSIRSDIDLEVIRMISYANDHVDKFTKSVLKNTTLKQSNLYNAISFGYTPFDINNYKQLIYK